MRTSEKTRGPRRREASVRPATSPAGPAAGPGSRVLRPGRLLCSARGPAAPTESNGGGCAEGPASGTYPSPGLPARDPRAPSAIPCSRPAAQAPGPGRKARVGGAPVLSAAGTARGAGYGRGHSGNLGSVVRLRGQRTEREWRLEWQASLLRRLGAIESGEQKRPRLTWSSEGLSKAAQRNRLEGEIIRGTGVFSPCTVPHS